MDGKKLELVDRKKFITEILIKNFEGNQAKCASELGISAASLCNFLKETNKRSNYKIMNAIYQYCIRNKLDYSLFFFPEVEDKTTKQFAT